jgi:hypothetical protein
MGVPRFGWVVDHYEYYNVTNGYRAELMLTQRDGFSGHPIHAEGETSVRYMLVAHNEVAQRGDSGWHGRWHSRVALQPSAIRTRFDFNGNEDKICK